jgi:hypothetical protein
LVSDPPEISKQVIPRQNAELNAAVIIEEVNAVVINPQVESSIDQQTGALSPNGFSRNAGK